MRDSKGTADSGLGAGVAQVARTMGAPSPESQQKVLELMAETFQGGLDVGMRSAARGPVGNPNPMLPKRAARAQGVGLAARTAGAATLGMRTGPSRGAAAAVLNRTLTAVDARIVGVLSQDGTPADLSPKVELALLANVRRSLQGQLAVVADDVVLCDSVVEYADGVVPMLADLQAGGKRRLRRLVEYSRELLSQVVALGGTGTELKAQVNKLRVALDQLPDENPPEDKLKPAAKDTLALYKRVCDELDRRSPRTGTSMLDGIIKI